MLPDSVLTLLEQVREAALFVLEQTRDVSFSQYCGNRIKRAIVERYFITIGEAMNRLFKADPATAAKIERFPRIIAFRNRVVHGYDTIDNAIVWAIIEKELPRLLTQVQALLQERECP